MRFLLDKIKPLNTGWNERPLTDADFQRICRRLRVTVHEMPLRVGGFYQRVHGRDYIAIDSRLSGTAKLLVQFHELAHFLFHMPMSGATANFHGLGRKNRLEREADLFAICALIPRTWLETRSMAELIDEGIPPDTLSERIEILANHGI
jgi:Zn-dependent peptidase ImmA (M78 family)